MSNFSLALPIKMCDLGALDEKVELITILNLKTLAYFRSKSEFYIKILSILIEISSFSKMVSIIWKLKFGKQGIILNLHDTFEHGRVLGRSNLKNRLRQFKMYVTRKVRRRFSKN